MTRKRGRKLEPAEVEWLETRIAEKDWTKEEFYAAYKLKTGRPQDPRRQLQRILNSDCPLTPAVRVNLAKTLEMSINEFDASLRKCLTAQSARASTSPLPLPRKSQMPKLEEGGIQTPGAFSIEFRKAHQKFEALTNKALDDEAANFVVDLGERSSAAKMHTEGAFWFGKAASAYRRQGRLFFAGDYYGRAIGNLKLALRQARNSPKLLSQLHAMELQLEFGRIIAEDYMNKGDFEIAFGHHAKLIRDADILLSRPLEDEIASEVKLRRIHFERQQAEMSRYMGDYRFALRLIRKVQRLYPESADEAIRYSELSEADSLRLLGKLEEADKIYERLQRIGEERNVDGLLGSVLWRRASALQLLRDRKTLLAIYGKIEKLAERAGVRHKYFGLYSCLVRAAASLPSARQAERLVREAVRIGDLSELHRRTEFAHCLLIRAEADRAVGRDKTAAHEFTSALKLYRQMPMNWGIARAWIGLHLVGESDSSIPRGLQGEDKEILDDFNRGTTFTTGALVVGLP